MGAAVAVHKRTRSVGHVSPQYYLVAVQTLIAHHAVDQGPRGIWLNGGAGQLSDVAAAALLARSLSRRQFTRAPALARPGATRHLHYVQLINDVVFGDLSRRSDQ